jgi:asparagine synthase (glutamine-hydrolysing)
MCGISGLFRVQPAATATAPGIQSNTAAHPDVAFLRTMIEAIAHRGPDGQGIFSDLGKGVALGHCRLAIMDPVGGAQPLYSEDNDSVLVSNGEIYNHQALRRQLIGNHQFYTATDNEAILHLVEEHGPAALAQLDGMYAFALYREHEYNHRRFLLARDPIGIKPLYYATEQGDDPTAGDALYFASELKAFTGLPLAVHEFPPGTYFDSEQGFVTYYRVPDHTPVVADVAAIAAGVRRRLEAAVTKRMMSDVPLGAFLSGGLDSSLIAAIARQQVEELHTFSVGIAGSNDIAAARVVADHIGSIHHEYLYTAEEVMAHLPAILYHLESFDQDLVRSAIPCYFCSRLAADYVKVILTGEGADELFAGYTYYKTYNDPQQLHAELRRSVTALHNINLQRVDRLTMAHGIEGRVPFLDTDLIAYAQTIDPALKLKPTPSGRRIEKWILRKACEDLLPSSIVWRDKEQFDEGSGTVDLLGPVIAAATANLDSAAYCAAHVQDQLRSAEECYYHQLLSKQFAQPRLILDNVARWSAAR